VVAWSSDDRTIYANRVNPPFIDADTYSIDVATGKLENLTSHQGTIRYLASSLSPDGGTLLLRSDAKGGYMNIALLDLGSRKITWATDLRWEAYAGSFSPDGKNYSYVVNENALIDAYLANRSTNRAEKLDLPHGLNSFSGNPSEFASQGDRVIVSHASNQPGDLWVYSLASRHADQLPFPRLPACVPRRSRPPRSSITGASTERPSALCSGCRLTWSGTGPIRRWCFRTGAPPARWLTIGTPT